MENNNLKYKTTLNIRGHVLAVIGLIINGCSGVFMSSGMWKIASIFAFVGGSIVLWIIPSHRIKFTNKDDGR